MNTLVLSDIASCIEWRRQQSGRIGFVPTMGALHEGHEELLKRARAENDLVVLSVFVNPTQFNDPKDFEKYPNTWDADLAMARKNGVDAVFHPVKSALYPDDYRYRVSENDFSTKLCGAHRPGHFDGVLTVVLKLFQLVKPTKAYFGGKDRQQLQLIEGMVKAFFLDLQIVPVPTVREKDGLAMSSRNRRLSPEERKKAPLIYQIITSAKSALEARAQLEKQGFNVDYVEDHGDKRFVAAFLGETRLIDNVGI
jgi:pantoate--beta-alanine ligase